jgi:acyl-coenzyme A thioesterase 13
MIASRCRLLVPHPMKMLARSLSFSGSPPPSSSSPSSSTAREETSSQARAPEVRKHGFIWKAATLGSNALLGVFLATDGFDSKLRGMRIDSMEKGYVKCSMVVTKEVTNSYETLHGACTSLLIDVVGTIALLTNDPLRPGVSVEINSSYISSAKLGETIIIEGTVLKSGKTLGYTQVDIKTVDGKLISTGRHTKFIGK